MPTGAAVSWAPPTRTSQVPPPGPVSTRCTRIGSSRPARTAPCGSSPAARSVISRSVAASGTAGGSPAAARMSLSWSTARRPWRPAARPAAAACRAAPPRHRGPAGRGPARAHGRRPRATRRASGPGAARPGGRSRGRWSRRGRHRRRPDRRSVGYRPPGRPRPPGGLKHPVPQALGQRHRFLLAGRHDCSINCWSSIVSSLASASRSRDFAVPSGIPAASATSR
jgi:hypothetical protein